MFFMPIHANMLSRIDLAGASVVNPARRHI
jgi:hypothetical protein